MAIRWISWSAIWFTVENWRWCIWESPQAIHIGDLIRRWHGLDIDAGSPLDHGIDIDSGRLADGYGIDNDNDMMIDHGINSGLASKLQVIVAICGNKL